MNRMILALMISAFACSKASDDPAAVATEPVAVAPAPVATTPPPAPPPAPVVAAPPPAATTPAPAGKPAKPAAKRPASPPRKYWHDEDAAVYATLLSAEETKTEGGAELGHADPGAALNAQIGEARAAAADPGTTRINLQGRQALDGGDVTEIVTRYFSAAQPSVRRCYVAAPPAPTRLTLRFAVMPDGSVVDATALSALAPLATCVQEVMPRWTFAKQREKHRFELVLALVPD